MKRLLLLTIFLVLSCTVCSANLLSSKALVEAEQFVSLIDEGNYQDAYLSASRLLRLSVPENVWLADRRRSEGLLGHVLKRKLVSVKARETYPGLPDGNYLVVYYEAQTKLKAKAAEVLLLWENADKWKVCSYRVR